MNSLKIEFDRDYGCDKRTGWSIVVDGSFVAKLESFLMVAIIKVLWTYFFILEK